MTGIEFLLIFSQRKNGFSFRNYVNTVNQYKFILELSFSGDHVYQML